LLDKKHRIIIELKVKELMLTIGFLLQNISYPLGKSLFDGVVAAAEAGNDKVLCFLGNPARTENLIPWYSMTLNPEISGLLIYGGGLGQFENEEEVSSFFKFFKNKSMLNIGYPLDGYNNLCVDNFMGMKALVLHLINIHKHSQIAIVRGPEGHPEANQRLAGYREALESQGIAFDPGLVIPGDFTLSSGREAAKSIYKLWYDKKITALAISSDSMALSCIQELRKMGVTFPDDLAVVSFDNTEEAVYQLPGLTTADQQIHNQGREAVKIIRNMIDGGFKPGDLYFPVKLIFRESCGCVSDMIRRVTGEVSTEIKEMLPLDPRFLDLVDEDSLEELRRCLESDIEMKTDSAFFEYLISFKPLSDYINNQESQSTLLRGFQDYVSMHRVSFLDKCSPKQRRGMEKIWHQTRVFLSMQLEYLLTSKKVDGDYMMRSLNTMSNQFISSSDFNTIKNILDEHLSQYKVDLCGISLFEEESKQKSYSLKYLFSRKKLEINLPLVYSSELFIPDDLASFWDTGVLMITPLIVQNHYWGNMFFIIKDKLTVNDGVFIESLSSQIATSLQHIQLLKEKNRAVEQLENAYLGLEIMNRTLEDLSYKDELTGLLNRRGFLELASQLIQDCRDKGSDFLLLFADLDGLKSINDTYGHEAGDFAIRSIGKIIKSTCRDKDIIARLGGDEFVAFIPNIPENYSHVLESRLQKSKTAMNEQVMKPFNISSSFGIVLGSEFPDKNLSFLMSVADKRLYSQKAKKKSVNNKKLFS